MRKLVILVLIIQFMGCTTGKRLLQKAVVLNEPVKFYSLTNSDNRSQIKKIIADVDSAGYKYYYSFYPGTLILTTQYSPQTKLELAYAGTVGFRPFTQLDSLIVAEANKIFASNSLDSFKVYTKGAGFQEEIYFIHGWPKGRRFRPL
jgi:hypothetical protein